MSNLAQPDEPQQPSRRTFLALNSGLLAAVTLGAWPWARANSAPSRADLALNRPVQVSSTDYAPTPADFAVDGVSAVGSPNGTGWRAAAGDPQWISVDLQAICQVDKIGLVFEATRDTPPFVPPADGDPRASTMGNEILSSCAVAYTVAVSTDGKSWQNVSSSGNGAGGSVQIPLSQPVMARWVRLTVTQRSTSNPLGLDEFQVFGTSPDGRPPVIGWTMPHHKSTGAPPELTVAAGGMVPVETGWELAMDDWIGTADGAALSRAGVNSRRWFDAIVPGTVLAALVADGALPDPVAGLNNLQVPEALCRHAWWYRREFRVPKGLGAGGPRVWLEFDGVNHEAQVWLNGRQVGTLTYPFARAAFDVTDALQGGQGLNVLAVRVTPMPHPGSPGDKENGLSFVNSYELELDAPTYVCASGWDWMPTVRDRATGIWNHVRLRATGDAVIGDAQVQTTLPDLPSTGTAEVSITVPVRNAAATARPVTVTAAFGPVTVTGTTSVAANSGTDVTFTPQQYPALRVANPRLWWPNGYGPANLYDLTLTAAISGVRSDTRVIRFGIRELGYHYQRPSIISGQEQDLTFPAVQARYVRMMGYTRATQYGFSLCTLSVFGPQAPGTDLALHKIATASSADDPSHGPQNAVDGDPSTRWSSAYQDNQWIDVDLSAVYSLDRVVLVWETAMAKTFAIQTSTDGSTWTTARNVTVGGLQLVKLELHDARGNLLSDNLYWNYGTPQDMQALNSLPPATITPEITDRQAGQRPDHPHGAARQQRPVGGGDGRAVAARSADGQPCLARFLQRQLRVAASRRVPRRHRRMRHR